MQLHCSVGLPSLHITTILTLYLILMTILQYRMMSLSPHNHKIEYTYLTAKESTNTCPYWLVICTVIIVLIGLLGVGTVSVYSPGEM